MNLSLPCPECGRNLKLPLSVAGKTVRCPMCTAVFTATDPSAAAEPAPMPSQPAPLPLLPVPPVPATPPLHQNPPRVNGPSAPPRGVPFAPTRVNAPTPTSKTGKRLGYGGLVFIAIVAMRCLFSFGSRPTYEPPQYVVPTFPDFHDRHFLDDMPKLNFPPTAKLDNWHEPLGQPTAFVVVPTAPRRLVLDFKNTTVTGMALTMDDQTLIVACANGWLYKFDPDTGAIQSECNRGDPTPAVVAVSADGSNIAVAHDDSLTGLTKLGVHVPALDMIKAVDTGGRNNFQAGAGALAYLPPPCGKTLANVEDGRLSFHKNPFEPLSVPTFEARVLSFSFSPVGRLLAAVLEDGSVHVWHHGLGLECHVFQEAAPLRSAPVFSPDGNLLVGCVGKDAKVWDTKRGQLLRTLRGAKDPQGFRASAFAPDGRMFATWQDDGTIRLWNVTTGTVFADLPHDKVNDGWPPVLAFRKDGKTLIAGGGQTVTFWNIPAALKK